MMKSLIYKGFGRDGKGEVKFNISVVDEDLTSKVLVEAFASDVKFTAYDYTHEDEEKVNVNLKSLIMDVSQTLRDVQWDYLSAEEWGYLYEGTNPGLLTKKFPISVGYFSDIPSSVEGIKSLVDDLRTKWRNALGIHNKLVVELKELSVEAFLEEAPLEITLSQTVVKK